MASYLCHHPNPRVPLFVMSHNHFLTRFDMVSMLRRCLPDVMDINTHSFRIGGASAAASAGVPDSVIQILGRWSSDAYKRYLHLSNDTVKSLSRQLSHTWVLSKFWSYNLLASQVV